MVGRPCLIESTFGMCMGLQLVGRERSDLFYKDSKWYSPPGDSGWFEVRKGLCLLNLLCTLFFFGKRGPEEICAVMTGGVGGCRDVSLT